MRHLLGEDLTAIDLSDILGINESAVRGHLGKLENEGLVESYFEKADIGRPKKYYGLTDEGKGLFPRETELMLGFLVKRIREKYGEEDMDDLADGLAEDIAAMFPSIEPDDDLETRIEKLVEGFDELGFFSSYEKRNDHYTVTYRNCVFGDLPGEHASWLCDIHQRMIRKVLGDVEIDQKRSIVTGDKICVQDIGG